MLFNNEFFDNLPNDKYEIGIIISSTVINYKITNQAHIEELHHYNELIDGFGALITYINANRLTLDIPELKADKFQNAEKIVDLARHLKRYLSDKKSESVLNDSLDRYKGKFDGFFQYRFTDGDLERIQTLINELRNLITSSELFNAKHKERLINKLETLQSELHKRMSSLDKFWGFVSEAGVVLGKFGQDAKPFVDRIREIAQIIWRTQATAEELPSGTNLPSLGN